MKESCMAGCGIEITAEEGWVCPYHSNYERWVANGKRGYGSCEVDLQIGTNICLHAPREVFDSECEQNA